MAEIGDEHVEWRVVDRLRELIEKLPDTPHDVTLTYSLFSSIVCWTCQRLRDDAAGSHKRIWQKLCEQQASAYPWNFDVAVAEEVREPTGAAVAISVLPAGRFLIGVRNAIAHGDHNRITPHHLEVQEGRPDRRLIGFTFTTDFQQIGRGKDGEPVIVKDWGSWRFDLTSMDMRRIGLSLAERFCNGLSKEARADATKHIAIQARA